MRSQYSKTSVTVVRNLAELQPSIGDLEDLAGQAIEPNVFYEPWMIVPAMKWLALKSLRLILIHRAGGNSNSQRPSLIGFFPLEIRSHYNHFPVKTARLWNYKFCYLCMPLLHRDHAGEALDTFFQWFSSGGYGCRILEFGLAPGEGKIHNLLIHKLSTENRSNLVDVRWARPYLQVDSTADTYLEAAISGCHRKDLEKKERKLRQLGTVDYVCPGSAGEAAYWIDHFIKLEAKGWRGRSGVACSSAPSSEAFFREAMDEAWQRGRLNAIALRLSGELIGMRISLTSAEGSFAFETTYDERFSAYSPGLLLEVENIRRFHQAETRWMDSCADQNSPLFTRVWTGKRPIETHLISAGNRLGDFWIAAIPVGHFLRRCFRLSRRPFSTAAQRLPQNETEMSCVGNDVALTNTGLKQQLG